ncbi:MAG: LysM peptidoglycan-binding domain-containing protein [Anaerolineae bacterium]
MNLLIRRLPLALISAVLAMALLVPPVSAQGQAHVVRRGETLYAIAARYGTTVQAISSANGLRNPSYIYAGQRLIIPRGRSSGGTTSAPATATGGAYTVRRGDTLWSIATRHGTTIAALRQANGLGSNVIYTGQRLVIPGGSRASNRAVTQASGGGQVYTVRRGDTLSSIAYRYGTTAWAISQANGLANPSYIYPGQRLRIPSGGNISAAPAPAIRVASRRILVDLSAQRMYVYQNGQLLWNWVVSTGRPGQDTAVGKYKVQNKIPNAYAYTWNLQMPYWLGIYWAGSLQNGIHALPIQANGQRLWAGYLGQRVSFGCIILSTQNAQTLYNWATVGTPVDIVW